MKKQLDIYKRLHGQNKHTCKRPGCTRMVLGDFCLEHLEAAIAGAWDEINETCPPAGKLPEGEQQ